MQNKITDYSEPMIKLDHCMTQYRNAMLKHKWKEAFEISVKMSLSTSQLVDYTFGKLDEDKSW